MAKFVNGIDVEGLKNTIGAIKEKPELASFKFRASNKWIKGTNNKATVKGYYGAGEEHDMRAVSMTFDEDEPPVLLGNDKGPNPVEWVLVGLSGCLTTSLVAYAAAKGIELRSVESELEGDLDVRGFLNLDPNVRNGYQNIRVHFKIDADASDEEVRKLVEIAQQRSPVFDIVTHQVPVQVDFERMAARSQVSSTDERRPGKAVRARMVRRRRGMHA
ncbi:OsmC family protein [Desulfocurvibacter africanus]|uniref:OsmC family protein n=1 Tax=Desulfocurvibacter africanus subsp. africanus str. Walvis Bay TaxID=690850 RepID=F3YUC1_DESAF|nr:OsmC family protein [Desulfocurvibacter africanus]EGJ48803.1 OsmC family protein [Desulfocurvibacter africanus subsp. africanus str. Walvis Bay]